ncbi:MAG: DNA-binding domain-containing protein [Usitatibacter sp.]
MSALAALQRDFIEVLYAADPPADPRLAIHHGNARANWRGALAAAYPTVRRLVGSAFFDAACDGYARAYPSRSGDLATFGGDLAPFLAGYAPAAALDYLPDVARLDRAVHESFHAADAEALDLAALARVREEDYGGLRLTLHPAARLLESAHPVVAIWEANLPDRDGTPDRTVGADRVLVMRHGFEPRPRALPASEWDVLALLATGTCLGEVCDALGDRAALLQDILARHAAEGVLCRFETAA